VAAYVIADIAAITNPEIYAQYRAQVLATVTAHGGRFIVRGGASEALEADWRPARIVVLEFPDMAAAKRWYESAEYGPLAKLRQSASIGRLLLVDGA
jgi:uncharacterized protein (DUF1330 family)